MKKELIFINGGLMVFCFLMLHFINQLPPPTSTVGLGPAFFPKLIIYFIIIINVLQIVKILFNRKDPEYQNNSEKIDYKSLLFLLGIMVLYIFSLDLIDYKISTIFFIMSIMYLLGIKNYKKLLIVPGITVLLIFVLFEIFLNVRMP